MDNVLRCSIIFMTLHLFCIHFGVASINPIVNTNFNKVLRQGNHLDASYSNDAEEYALPWLKVHPLIPNSDNYDFDDYNQDGEQLDDSIEYSNENTQSVGSDYDNDDEEYEENESQISAYKRGRYVPHGKRTDKHVDLCPIYKKPYRIRADWRLEEYELLGNYTELICNHTTTSPSYDRQYNREYNRICYSLGRTFEYGHGTHGTHCFQRFRSKEILVKSIDGKKRDKYTVEHFRDGCTCGWATDELGPIEDYHYDKILNLCSELKDRV